MLYLKKAALWLLKAAVVLTVVLYASAGVATLWFGRQVERKTEAIAAKGEPIYVADVAGAYRGKGAAAFQAAEARFGAVRPSSEESEALLKLTEQPQGDLSPEEWDLARVGLAKLGPFLDEVAAAIASGEVTVGYVPSGILESPIRSFSLMRNVARALLQRAVVRTRDGDAAGATIDVETALRLSQVSSPRCALIGALVQMACVRVSCVGVQNCLRTETFSREQTRRLCQALAQAAPEDLLPKALLYERAISYMFLQISLNEGTGIEVDAAPSGMRVFFRKLKSLPTRAFLYANESATLDATGRAVLLSRKKYRDLSEQERDRQVTDQVPRWALLSRMFLPAYSRSRMAADLCTAEVEATRAMLALSRYKAEHGAYPAQLKDAQSDACHFGDDPFSGKPLVYRRQGDGVMLYSIGADLKDNGGKQANGSNRSVPGTDLVWTMPGKAHR